MIHYIRTKIKPEHGGVRNFEVQCGSSVGAINTCFMAAHADNTKQQGQKIFRLWCDLKREQIYERNIGALGALLGRTTRSISANLLKLYSKAGQTPSSAHFKGFLDTSPLPTYLNSVIPFKKIRQNLRAGLLSAVSITATNISTGRMELFIQKRPNVDYTGAYVHSITELTAEHVRASASMPLIFQPIKIKNTYYTDGSLKLNTPMSPVMSTCVPPHNSIEKSPKLSTRTSLPYFSPNNATAPDLIASS